MLALLVLASSLAQAAAPLSDAGLKAFIDARHAGVPRELFLSKLGKAAASDAAFFRAMPDLFYDLLRRSPQAPTLAAAPEVLLAGDVHAENVEIVGGVPQINDFDDAARGPAALDAARLLAGAALLEKGLGKASLVEAARAAYLDSLAETFDGWRRGAARESAVAEARVERRDWATEGRAVRDPEERRRYAALAGLPAPEWTPRDRAGAGLSSIGARRYAFARRGRRYARELKELRESSTSLFTGRLSPSQGERVAGAWSALRQKPVEARALSGEGAEWLLRRREGSKKPLDFLRHPRSAARVMGGLLAQLHLAQADAAALSAAMAAIGVRDALEWAKAMSEMRAGLRRLLAEGAWA